MAKNGKLSMEEFTRIAIVGKRKGDHKGILTRTSASGYFGGFVTYFGVEPYKYDSKSKKYTGWLPEAVAKGKFEGHPVGSGTWVVYLKGEGPKSEPSKAAKKEADSLLKLVAKAAKS